MRRTAKIERTAPVPSTTPELRFWNHVRKTESCWLWTASSTTHGGTFHLVHATSKLPGRQVMAHRYSWQLSNGKIPRGKWVKQSCLNVLCVNPSHLILMDGQGVKPDVQRFWRKVNKTATCWLWTGSTLPFGHGTLGFEGNHWLAHRLSWHLHFGPIPIGKKVLHDCDVPACINPKHLYIGTDQDNANDKVDRGRQQKGDDVWNHALTEPETIVIIQLLKSGMIRGHMVACANRIAAQYLVHVQTIWAIHYRRSWKHLPR